MHQTEQLYAFNQWTRAQDYEINFELPILRFDSIQGGVVRDLYKVVYDGELKDSFGRVIGRRKLWELVE